MSAQVFISYSNQDRAVAESIHDALEKAGIPAWLAHRDLTAGVSWSQRIIDEIHASRVMILLLSRHANESQYVIREVGEAVERQASILTVRIEDVAPSKGLKFFIGAEQWLDAFALPKQQYLKRVVEDVRLLLGTEQVRRSDAPPRTPIEKQEVARVTTSSGARLSAWLREHRGAVRVALVLVAIVAAVVVGMSVLPSFEPAVMIATEPAGLQQLHVGDSLQLTLQSTHDTVIWSSSNAEVVSISPGSSVFRAVGEGTAVLRAQAGSKSDSVQVTIVPAPVTAIAIQPPPASIRVGDTWKFSVTAKDAAGRNIAYVPEQWRSETPRLVSIDSAGLATGVAAGRGRISVRVDTLTATVDVAVVARPRVVTGDPGRATDPPVTNDPPRPRDSTQINVPVQPSLPSEAELTRWADLCLARLKSKDVQWVESNFQPPTAADQDNLERLKNVMGQNRYNVSDSGMGAVQPDNRSIDFWVQFSYTAAFGRNVTARATFRVLGAEQAGVWRMASCRTVGAITTR